MKETPTPDFLYPGKPGNPGEDLRQSSLVRLTGFLVYREPKQNRRVAPESKRILRGGLVLLLL